MKRWYLLYCKRSEQARAKMHLENQGVECYYPEIEVDKIVRNKRQVVKEPLFPSYVFVRFDYEEGPSFTTIRSTRGVSDFIRFGPHPQEVTDSLVEDIRAFTEQKSEEIEDQLPQSGELVRVKSGQFEGVDAIYHEPDGEKRSIMLITIINQPTKVIIDNQDLDI